MTAECLRLAAASYGILVRRIDAFLVLAAPWIFLHVAAAKLLARSDGATLVQIVLLLTGGSAVAVGWHRILLLDETPLGALRPRLAVLEFMGFACFAFALATFCTILASVLFVLLSMLAARVVGSILVLFFLLFLSRWLMAFPALAIGDPQMDFRRGLRPSFPGARQWSVLAGTWLAGFPALCLEGWLAPAAPASRALAAALAVLEPGLLLAAPALLAGYSTALYLQAPHAAS